MEQDDIEIVGRDYDPHDPSARIDDTEAFPEDRPYPPLDLVAEGELLELEQLTADQVATVRDERSMLIANLGVDKLPHFLTNVEGVEHCGIDSEPWPCTAWRTQVDPAAVIESSGVPAEAPFTPGEVAAAEALGITAAEVRERMAR